jgi:sigma-B regulation protein RsbU (phosphoserine phosphatase)
LLRTGQLKRAVNVVECTRLQDAARAGGDTEELQFHATVPLISQRRPLGVLNVASNEWEFLTAADLQFLSAVGAQVATAIERARLYDLSQAQRARMERELETARTVQAGLLPHPLPSIPGFQLAADWRSAREVAGDFYDVFTLPGGRWGIVIADVSDKGAPAALYMAMARSLIRATRHNMSSPAEALMQVNEVLCTQTSVEMFVTVFYAMLDPATRSLTYANAGHNPPIIRRAAAPGIERLPYGGTFIGMLEDIHLADSTISLEPGDALVAYTDGLTDAENSQHEYYDVGRLAATIATAPATAPALLAHLLADLDTFTGDAPALDDITVLVMTCETLDDYRL